VESGLHILLNVEVMRRVRDGHKTSFWRGGGGETLRSKFPRLFAISNQKEATVAAMKSDDGTISEWNFSWRRRLFVWEENLLENLLAELDGVELSLGEDR